MSKIDERVVAMRFQNSQFLDGAKKALGALDELKSSLNFKDSRGLESVATQAQGLSPKFLALGTIAVTALANITNQALDMGVAFTKSVTGIEAMRDGFAEYELKMGSIQTILANTEKYGTTLDDVTRSLDDLNHYADKTIYNFGDMTKNIGLFTNAGIQLEDATSMIKGFSNAAAASGTTAQGAAGAAYQLSQALSAGTITLMDWKSLTNVGMGNKNMQEGLIKIADAMGTFNGTATNATKAAENFNGSLEHKWLSADVMSTYLKIMAGDMDAAAMSAVGLDQATIDLFTQQQQTAENAATKVRTWTQLIGTLKEAAGSSWTDSFTTIIGDFEEATNLFTYVSDQVGNVLGAMGESRNAMLDGWKAQGGWEDLWGKFDADGVLVANGALQNLFDTVKNIAAPIANAWKAIFPPDGGNTLKGFTGGLNSFTGMLKNLTAPLANLQPIFQAVFGVLKIGWDVIKGVFSTLGSLFGLVGGAGTGGVLAFAGSIGMVVQKLVDWINNGRYIEKFFTMLNGWISKIAGPIFNVFSTIGNAIRDAFVSRDISKFTDAFKGMAPSVQKVAGFVKDLIAGFVGIYNILTKGDFTGSFWGMEEDSGFVSFLFDVRDAFMGVQGATERAKAGVQSFFNGFKGLYSILANGDFLGADFTFGLDEDSGFVNFLFNVRDAFMGVTGAGDQLQGSMDGLAASGESVKNGWEKVVDVFKAIGSFMQPVIDAVKTGFNWIKERFQEFFAGEGMIDVAALMQGGIFVLLFNIQKALNNFTKGAQDWSEFPSKIKEVFESLAQTLTDFGESMKRQALGKLIMSIAIALAILAAALIALTFVDPAKLGIAIGALSAAMAGLVAILQQLTKITNPGAMAKMVTSLAGVAVSTVALAGALLIMAAAVKVFGSMDMGTLAKGMGAMVVALGALVGAMKLLSMIKGEALAKSAASLLLIAAAIGILAPAIALLGVLPMDNLAKGMGTLAGGLAVMAGALMLLGNFGGKGGGGNLAAAAGAIAIVAVALGSLAPPIALLGALPVETLGKGLGALVVGLGMITVALNILGSTGPIILAAAGAIAIVAGSIMVLALVPWANLANGMAQFAEILFKNTGYFLAAIPAVIALSISLAALGVAVVVFGAGMLAAGAGMLMFATGFALLAASASVGTVALTAAITAVASLLPMIAGQIGLAMLSFADAISTGGPAIVNALTTVFNSLIQAANNVLPQLITLVGSFIEQLIADVSDRVPRIAESLVKMLVDLMEVFNTYMPQLAEQGTQMIVNFIDGITNHMSEIIDAGGRLIVAFIEGIGNNMTNIVGAAATTIVNFLNGLSSNLGKIIAAGTNLIVNLITGIGNSMTDIIAAATDTAVKFIDGLGDNAQKLIDAGTDLIIKLIEGVGEAAGRITTSAGETILKFLNEFNNAITTYGPQINSAGAKIVENIIKGVASAPLTGLGAVARGIGGGLLNGVKNILGINSPSKAFKELGGYVVEGFVLGIKGSSDQIGEVFSDMTTRLNTMLADTKESIKKYQDDLKRNTWAVDDALDSLNDKKKEFRARQREIEKIRKAGNDTLILPEEQKKINELTEQNRRLAREIEKAQDTYNKAVKTKKQTQSDLTSALDEQKKLQAAIAADKSLSSQKKQLASMTKQYEGLVAKLEDANKALDDLVQAREDAKKSYADSFGTLPGTDDASTFSSYVDSLQKQVTDTIKFNETLSALRDLGLDDKTYKKLLEQGVSAQGLMEDILKQGASGIDTITGLTNNLDFESVNLADKASRELYDAGVNAAQGLVDGLEAKSKDLKKQMDKLADTMVVAIKKALGIKSPSRVFMELGDYATKGLVKGLEISAKDVDKTAAGLGGTAAEALQKSLSNLGSDIDGTVKMAPVITPVLDLTEIKKAASGIDGALGKPQLTLGAAADSAKYISLKRDLIEAQKAAAAEAHATTTAVNFTQNITSPKAISKADVYRQTKNQLSRAKGALS